MLPIKVQLNNKVKNAEIIGPLTPGKPRSIDWPYSKQRPDLLAVITNEAQFAVDMTTKTYFKTNRGSKSIAFENNPLHVAHHENIFITDYCHDWDIRPVTVGKQILAYHGPGISFEQPYWLLAIYPDRDAE